MKRRPAEEAFSGANAPGMYTSWREASVGERSLERVSAFLFDLLDLTELRRSGGMISSRTLVRTCDKGDPYCDLRFPNASWIWGKDR